MLILTRRPGESLIIETPAGEQIQVTVLGVKGQQVRIGTDELLEDCTKPRVKAEKRPFGAKYHHAIIDTRMLVNT